MLRHLLGFAPASGGGVEVRGGELGAISLGGEDEVGSVRKVDEQWLCVPIYGQEGDRGVADLPRL